MISVFSSFMLSKLTHLVEKTNTGDIQEDELAFIMNPVKEFLNSFGIENIHAYNFITLDYGYEGTAHIINYLGTYTPIFMIAFFFIKVLGLKLIPAVGKGIIEIIGALLGYVKVVIINNKLATTLITSASTFYALNQTKILLG